MPDPLSAWGSAEREKWKAIQKAIPLTNRIGNFLGMIVGPAASSLGGILDDQMRAWRAANLDRIAKKWQARLHNHSVSAEIIKQLPFREAIALVDAASQEDDDDVQQLWANLIANATNFDAAVDISKMHIDLLKSLNGLEARVLIVIFALYDDGNFSNTNLQKTWKAALSHWPKLKSEQLQICLQNLQRIGLLTPNITEMEILGHNTFEEWEANMHEKVFIAEFQKITKNLVLEITNLTGNPMNDLNIPNTKKDQISLIEKYGLTRIGFDLYNATSARNLVPKTANVKRDAKPKRSKR